MVHKLEELDNTRTDWKVKVRVTRMWPSISHDGNTIIRFNLILLDKEDYHVRASVYPDVWNAFVNVLLEGNIYEVSNFLITDATNSLRIVSSKVCINFTHETIVNHIIDDEFLIPRHKFEFVKLEDVYQVASSYEPDQAYLNTIDVIGVIDKLESPKVFYSVNGEHTVVKFRLTNGSHSVKVAFRQEHVASLDPLFDGNLETPTIVILAGLIAHQMHGFLQLCTIECSRIYYNLDHPDVLAMRHRLHEEGTDDIGNAS